MLYMAFTWPEKENDMAIHHGDMRWMYDMKLKNKLYCMELREWLEIEDVLLFCKVITNKCQLKRLELTWKKIVDSTCYLTN